QSQTRHTGATARLLPRSRAGRLLLDEREPVRRDHCARTPTLPPAPVLHAGSLGLSRRDHRTFRLYAAVYPGRVEILFLGYQQEYSPRAMRSRTAASIFWAVSGNI